MLSQRTTRHWATVLGAIYFTSLATVLAWTYIPRHLAALGFSGVAIGTLFSARSIVQTLATPAWAVAADRFDATRPLLQLQIIGGLLAAGALPFLTTQPAIFAAVLAYAVTVGCALPLVDALALRELGADKFGRIRAWGSVGFGACALAAALVGIFRTHGDIAALAPAAIAALAVGTFAVATRLPGVQTSVPTASLADLSRLLRRLPLLAIFLLGAGHWASQAPYNLFIVFLCEEREMGGWVPGLAVGVGIAAEVAIFAAGPAILRRIRPLPLLAITFAATTVRWLWTAQATSTVALIALQAFHGITFGGFYIAMVAILAREVRPGLRATGQALFYFAVFGWGGAAGNFAAGALLDHHPPSTLFWYAGLLELACLVLCLAMWRGLRRRW